MPGQNWASTARVCVEVEASMDIPKSIEVELRDGKSVTVHVEIPWMPAKCSKCEIFGHGDKTCAQRPIGQTTAKIWVPKAQKVITEKRNTRGEEEERGPIEQQEKKKEVEKVVVAKAVKIAKAGSLNRYAILDSITQEKGTAILDSMEQIEGDIEPRKARAASQGVADLMKTLKPKKKGPIDKGKVKAGSTALRGQTSSSTS